MAVNFEFANSERRYNQNIESIIEKYNRPFENDDVLDLTSYQIVQNNGMLVHRNPKYFGSSRLRITKRDQQNDSAYETAGSNATHSAPDEKSFWINGTCNQTMDSSMGDPHLIRYTANLSQSIAHITAMEGIQEEIFGALHDEEEPSDAETISDVSSDSDLDCSSEEEEDDDGNSADVDTVSDWKGTSSDSESVKSGLGECERIQRGDKFFSAFPSVDSVRSHSTGLNSYDGDLDSTSKLSCSTFSSPNTQTGSSTRKPLQKHGSSRMLLMNHSPSTSFTKLKKFDSVKPNHHCFHEKSPKVAEVGKPAHPSNSPGILQSLWHTPQSESKMAEEDMDSEEDNIVVVTTEEQTSEGNQVNSLLNITYSLAERTKISRLPQVDKPLTQAQIRVHRDVASLARENIVLNSQRLQASSAVETISTFLSSRSDREETTRPNDREQSTSLPITCSTSVYSEQITKKCRGSGSDSNGHSDLEQLSEDEMCKEEELTLIEAVNVSRISVSGDKSPTLSDYNEGCNRQLTKMKRQKIMEWTKQCRGENCQQMRFESPDGEPDFSETLQESGFVPSSFQNGHSSSLLPSHNHSTVASSEVKSMSPQFSKNSTSVAIKQWPGDLESREDITSNCVTVSKVLRSRDSSNLNGSGEMETQLCHSKTPRQLYSFKRNCGVKFVPSANRLSNRQMLDFLGLDCPIESDLLTVVNRCGKNAKRSLFAESPSNPLQNGLESIPPKLVTSKSTLTRPVTNTTTSPRQETSLSRSPCGLQLSTMSTPDQEMLVRPDNLTAETRNGFKTPNSVMVVRVDSNKKNVFKTPGQLDRQVARAASPCEEPSKHRTDLARAPQIHHSSPTYGMTVKTHRLPASDMSEFDELYAALLSPRPTLLRPRHVTPKTPKVNSPSSILSHLKSMQLQTPPSSGQSDSSRKTETPSQILQKIKSMQLETPNKKPVELTNQPVTESHGRASNKMTEEREDFVPVGSDNQGSKHFNRSRNSNKDMNISPRNNSKNSKPVVTHVVMPGNVGNIKSSKTHNVERDQAAKIKLLEVRQYSESCKGATTRPVDGQNFPQCNVNNTMPFRVQHSPAGDCGAKTSKLQNLQTGKGSRTKPINTQTIAPIQRPSTTSAQICSNTSNKNSGSKPVQLWHATRDQDCKIIPINRQTLPSSKELNTKSSKPHNPSSSKDDRTRLFEVQEMSMVQKRSQKNLQRGASTRNKNIHSPRKDFLSDAFRTAITSTPCHKSGKMASFEDRCFLSTICYNDDEVGQDKSGDPLELSVDIAADTAFLTNSKCPIELPAAHFSQTLLRSNMANNRQQIAQSSSHQNGKGEQYWRFSDCEETNLRIQKSYSPPQKSPGSHKRKSSSPQHQGNGYLKSAKTLEAVLDRPVMFDPVFGFKDYCRKVNRAKQESSKKFHNTGQDRDVKMVGNIQKSERCASFEKPMIRVPNLGKLINEQSSSTVKLLKLQQCGEPRKMKPGSIGAKSECKICKRSLVSCECIYELSSDDDSDVEISCQPLINSDQEDFCEVNRKYLSEYRSLSSKMDKQSPSGEYQARLKRIDSKSKVNVPARKSLASSFNTPTTGESDRTCLERRKPAREESASNGRRRHGSSRLRLTSHRPPDHQASSNFKRSVHDSDSDESLSDPSPWPKKRRTHGDMSVLCAGPGKCGKAFCFTCLN